MPTLLQIDSCLNTGSTGRITETIGRMAQNKGWECHIIHGARYANPPSSMHSIQTVSKVGEYIHYIKGLLFDNHGLSSKKETTIAVEQIKSIKPDVIHLHCIHGYYLNYQLLFEYLNSTNIPIVWTFHDCWAFTGHCAYFDRANCEKWKTRCFDCPLKGDYPKALVDHSKTNFLLKRELFTKNKNLHIVTVSKWLEALTKESFFAGNDIRTIYNGVDLKLFKPCDAGLLKKKLGLDNKKVLLAAATVWAERKGFADYLKLSNKLEKDIVIVLLGLDEKKKKCLPNNIVGLSRTESVEELALYYSLADIVLNLSYEETFGLTTAEGMACGTPSIVYNATASPEVISPDTGIVVSPGNINEVVNAIRIILDKGKMAYSYACRKRAESLYDKNRRFADYIDLYESLI